MTDAQRLLEQAAALRARASAKEGRAKQAARGAARARVALVGAFLLGRLGDDVSAWPDGWRAALDAWATRPRDRVVLGLAPSEKAEPSPEG